MPRCGAPRRLPPGAVSRRRASTAARGVARVPRRLRGGWRDWPALGAVAGGSGPFSVSSASERSAGVDDTCTASGGGGTATAWGGGGRARGSAPGRGAAQRWRIAVGTWGHHPACGRPGDTHGGCAEEAGGGGRAARADQQRSEPAARVLCKRLRDLLALWRGGCGHAQRPASGLRRGPAGARSGWARGQPAGQGAGGRARSARSARPAAPQSAPRRSRTARPQGCGARGAGGVGHGAKKGLLNRHGASTL